MGNIVHYTKTSPIDGELGNKFVMKLSVKSQKIIGYSLIANNERGGLRYSVVLLHEGGKIVLETFNDEEKAQQMFAALQAELD